MFNELLISQEKNLTCYLLWGLKGPLTAFNLTCEVKELFASQGKNLTTYPRDL